MNSDKTPKRPGRPARDEAASGLGMCVRLSPREAAQLDALCLAFGTAEKPAAKSDVIRLLVLDAYETIVGR